MFPNPQDALPLPSSPNLERYKKLAKGLAKICETGDHDRVHDWASAWVRSLVHLSGLEFTPGLPVEVRRWTDEVTGFAIQTLLSGKRRCALVDAQFVIARSQGFTSWPKLVNHIGEVARGGSPVADFEAAADVVVAGDLRSLEQFLRQNPSLIRECSTREHRATLLHYTSANGVEGYRQKTPKNIVEIAETLLESGAEVDAEANVYGGHSTTLGLVATSIHPAAAGVQLPLLQLLLDYDAQIERPNLGEKNRGAVISCLANGQPKAGEFLADRGARLDLENAAGVGRLDIVKSFFGPDGKPGPNATNQQLQKGFIWACMYGREEVAFFLLEHGADLRDSANSGGTALHWAAGAGYVSIVERLIQRGAALEEINKWGGTVLEQAAYGFEHSERDVNFAPVFETLLAAGARPIGRWLEWIEKVKNRSAVEKTQIRELFRRHGATT